METSRSFDAFLSDGARAGAPSAHWFANAVTEFRELNVHSCSKLAKSYADLAPELRFVAIAAFLQFDFDECRDFIWKDINSDNLALSTIVATALGRFSDENELRWLFVLAVRYATSGSFPSQLLFDAIRECRISSLLCEATEVVIAVLEEARTHLTTFERARGLDALTALLQQTPREEPAHQRGRTLLLDAMSDADPAIRESANESPSFLAKRNRGG